MTALKVFMLLLATWCSSLIADAQQVVCGTLTDEQQLPLPFAPVWLRDVADSSVIAAEYTDSLGHFLMVSSHNKQNTFLEIRMLGYTTIVQGIPASEQDTITYQLQLKPLGTLLNSVTINARKPLIERKADRTIFNVENSIAATGNDAYDVLKKAPGVRVNNGEISIAGKRSVSVMINDKLTQVSGSELESMLRSMPAGSISKIEVITAPPAKYDAEGNSGIINIVTKKSINNGFNGSITLSYEQRQQASQNLQSVFNYRQGKLNVYGTINANRFRFISQQQTNTEYPEQKQDQVLDQDNRPFYTWSQVGLDYTIGPRSVLGFMYTLGTMDTKRDEFIRTRVLQLPAALTDSVMNTDAFATDKGRRNVCNLNYDWKIDSSGKKLSLNADYFTRKGDKTRDFTTGNFYADGVTTGTVSNNYTYGAQKNDILTARADLEWPTRLAHFSVGAKASAIHNLSDNVFTYFSGPDYITDTGKSNTFDYRENTQAIYASAKQTWGKWNAQLGLRAEYTQTKGTSITLQQSNTNDYFKLFPSVYIQYKPNEHHSWNINYTRRINRPSFWDMNPFRIYSTATAYEEGNPFLQPSFSNNLELGYAYKSVLAFTAFVQKVDAYATRVSFIDTLNHVFHFGQANAGNELQYGLSATLSISPLPWWENTTQFFGTYNQFRSSFYEEELQYGKPSFSMETTNTFTLNAAQTFLAELNFEYNSRKQDDFDIQYASGNLGAGMKCLLFQKKLVMALYAEDILKTDIWQLRNQYNATYQHAYFDSRCVRLSLTWKFGNQYIKAKRERNSTMEESSRAN